jgi:hypothetical protein
MNDVHDELLTCPFCGGEGQIDRPHDYHYSDYPSDVWVPSCGECGCDLGEFHTKQDAAVAWNTRVTPDPNAPSMSMAEKVIRYSNTVGKHGPDSRQAEAVRRLHPGDAEFKRHADNIDQLKRFLGGSGIDYGPV